MTTSTPPTRAIVVVEDDPDFAFFLTRWLAGEDRYRLVATYGDVDSAQLAGWSDVQAAVVDIMLPRRSGAELLAWLASEHPHVRRVVSTALQGDIVPREVRDLADVILTKPFSMADLDAALRDS